MRVEVYESPTLLSVRADMKTENLPPCSEGFHRASSATPQRYEVTVPLAIPLLSEVCLGSPPPWFYYQHACWLPPGLS
ncbi:unnamed protein product [Boreogadus saida]